MAFRFQVGDLERLQERFGAVADFRFVYVREAYPAGSRSPAPVPEGEPVPAAGDQSERCATARRCVDALELDLPCVVDTMENAAVLAYDAFPLRLFVVDPAGRVVVRGAKGATGFGPDLVAAEAWLSGASPRRPIDVGGERVDLALELPDRLEPGRDLAATILLERPAGDSTEPVVLPDLRAGRWTFEVWPPDGPAFTVSGVVEGDAAAGGSRAWTSELAAGRSTSLALRLQPAGATEAGLERTGVYTLSARVELPDGGVWESLSTRVEVAGAGAD